MKRVVLVAMAALAFGPCASIPVHAQYQSTDIKSSAVGMADQKFVKYVYQGGLAEIELGKLAKTKASSDEVKQFADRLIADHGRFNDELKATAAQKSIELPSAVAAKHKATYDRLSKLSGAEFDRMFMQEMVTAHRNALNNFRTEARTGKDPDVKAWAGKNVPTLEQHLSAAERIAGTVGKSS